MIESVVIRKYIIQYFLDNSDLDISVISKNLDEYFSNHFLSKEYIYIKNLEETGRIVSFNKDECLVAVNVNNGNKMAKIKTETIQRKDILNANEIKEFLELVTQENLPFGRVLNPNVIENMFKLKNPNIQPAPSNIARPLDMIKQHQMTFKIKPIGEEEKVKMKKRSINEEEKKEKVKKPAKPEIAKLTEFLKITGKPYIINDIEESQIHFLLDLYGFCKCFSSHLGVFDFTLQHFISEILNFQSNFFFEIMSSILKILIIERKKNRTEGLKEIIENIQHLYFKDYEEKQMPSNFKRIQWFNHKITPKTWKIAVKSFLFDISSLLNLKNIFDFKIFDAKEEKNNEEKIQFLRFLICIVLETNVLKTYIEEMIENFKRKDKERNSENNRLRKLKYELRTCPSHQEENKKEIENNIKICQENIKKVTVSLYKSIWKLYIGNYENKKFFILDDKLIFEENNKFFEFDGSISGLVKSTEDFYDLNYYLKLFSSIKMPSAS